MLADIIHKVAQCFHEENQPYHPRRARAARSSRMPQGAASGRWSTTDSRYLTAPCRDGRS